MKLDNVNKIAIVGTGMIGTSLAVLFTGHGYKTCLYALNEELAEESKKTLSGILSGINSERSGYRCTGCYL